MTVDGFTLAYCDQLAREALWSMPERLRTPLVMRRGVEASDRDIAEALVISPTQAARRVGEGATLLYAYFARAGVPVAAADAMLHAHLATLNTDGFVDRVMQALDSGASPRPFVAAVECATYAAAGAVLGSGVTALTRVLRAD